jgi:pimeloyl-ACP methyl ester carboxylesterase
MVGAGTAVATNPERFPLDAGQGLISGASDAPETVLYLHGWGGSKELWWNTLRLLSDTARGIALDLPGVGETPLLPDHHTMRGIAQWVVNICDSLQLPWVTLVGHSLGGNLAAQVALEFPERVRRLAFVDAALEPSHFPARARWPLSPRFGLLALRLARWSAWPTAVVGRRVSHNHRGGYWLPYARRNHYYLASNSDTAMQTQLRALYDSAPDAARLAALNIPILIVHGARDGVIPVARAVSLAEKLPSAKLLVFPTAHHCPMDTDPFGFAQALREFLTRTGPCATMRAAERD